MHADEERLIRIEMQLNRLVADYESEKELRKERTKDINQRLAALERWKATWAGVLTTITVISALIGLLTLVLKL